MFRPTPSLGSVPYRGQRQLVVRALLDSKTGLTKDQLVAAVDNDGAYTKTFKNDDLAKRPTVPESVQFHLNALKKLGQITEEGQPSNVGVLRSVPKVQATFERIAVNGEEDVMDMAHNWYGYGRWDANYWFIGPEPGMDDSEDNDLRPRCNAWINLGAGELVDCKDHHFGFGAYDWHREIPPPRIQRTWEKLIALLLATRNGGTPKPEEIRSYQQRFWGMKNGETCVVELCSLAANKLNVKKAINFDSSRFRTERIEKLRRKIDVYRPRFVVMYRKKDKPYWEEIAGGAFGNPPDIRTIGNGPTLAVFADHPVSNVGVSTSYWLGIAETLRRKLRGN